MHHPIKQLLTLAQGRGSRAFVKEKEERRGVAVVAGRIRSHPETATQQPHACAAHPAVVDTAATRSAATGAGTARRGAAADAAVAAPAAKRGVRGSLSPGFQRSGRASVSSTAASSDRVSFSAVDEAACSSSSGEEEGPRGAVFQRKERSGSSGEQRFAAGRQPAAAVSSGDPRAASRRATAASPLHSPATAVAGKSGGVTGLLKERQQHHPVAAASAAGSRPRTAAAGRGADPDRTQEAGGGVTDMGRRSEAGAADRPRQPGAAAVLFAAEHDADVRRGETEDGDAVDAETRRERQQQGARDAPGERRSSRSSKRMESERVGGRTQSRRSSSGSKIRSSSRDKGGGGNDDEKERYGKAGGKGAAATAAAREEEGNQISRRYQTLLQVANPHELPDELLSDEEEDENRVGNIPMWWYDPLDHIGYNSEGVPLQKNSQLSQIEKLLAKSEGNEGWRTVFDIKNNRTVRLTDTDLEIIRRLHAGSFPLPTHKEDEFYIESDREDSIFPMHNKPEPKRRFLPSQHEQRKITHLVSLIRAGKLPPPPQRGEAAANQQEPPVFDMWKADIYTQHSLPAAAARGGWGAGGAAPALRAPKLPLPGHAESYNPPMEFLFTPEEEREWREMDEADRPLSFLPRRFAALRHVGAFQGLLLERFNRCLDLYLCPRSVKLRMNVDPASLLPELPPLNELKPFPSAIRVDFLPVAAYAQLQLLPRSLNTLPAAAAPLLPPSPAAATTGAGAAPATRGPADREGRGERREREGGKGGNWEKLEAEKLLHLACNYVSEGIAGVSIDPTGTWLAVGENITSSLSSSAAAAASSRVGRGEGKGERGRAPACLWIFEVSTGKPFLSFDLQQHVTAVAFHPRLPLLAVAVEEQLLLLVLDLPLFDTPKLLRLTSMTAAASSSSSSAVAPLLGLKKQRGVAGAARAAGDAGQEAQQDDEGEEKSAGEGGAAASASHGASSRGTGGVGGWETPDRRALLEEAVALLRDVEWPAGEKNKDEEVKERDGVGQQQAGAAAAAAVAREKQGKELGNEQTKKEAETDEEKNETPGARRRRQQQLLGAVGEWRQIRVKGIATAPAVAGTAGRLSKNSRLQQQPVVMCVTGNEEEEEKNRSRQQKQQDTLGTDEVQERDVAAAAAAPEGEADFSRPVICAPLGGILCGASILHDSTIRCLSWHRKGGYLVSVCPGSASPAQQCSVHSLKKKKTIHPLRKAAGGRMQAAAFHPTKPCLVLAYPKTIRIVNLQRRGGANDEDEDAFSRKLVGAENVCCVDVHAKGRQIVAGSGDQNVYVFDVDLSRRVYKTLRSHAGAVASVALHPHYPLLFTASHDGTVQLYHFKVFDDLLTNPLIIPIRKLRATGEGNAKVSACAWHPTQPWLVVGDSAGGCSLWG